MKKIIYATIVLLAIHALGENQSIPRQLWGKWRVHRELPTSTISCWDEKQARALIGTEIEYTIDSFRWKNVKIEHANANIKVVGAQQFHDENSGQGATGSSVTFHQLGIKSTKVTQITIDHPAAEITGATIEIPGDSVLLKAQNTIILSVCNVYFEAQRIGAPNQAKDHQ